MTHGSLFSGIGGFDLASKRMGWTNVFHCEVDHFAQRVLQHHFPESITYEDIKRTDFSVHRNGIDVLTGGFPCQPYSGAGKRKGKDDHRHLWPEMLRCVREVRPRWIVGENVFGLITWNGGMVFEEVCADLESEGYSVQPFVLPAAAVNAPHRRDRVWFIANATDNGCRGGCCKHRDYAERQVSQRECQGCTLGRETEGCDRERTSPNANGERYEELDATTFTDQQARQYRSENTTKWTNNWERFPTQSPICSRNDGLSDRLDGITFSKWRNQSIKAYGNAIVPQVAFQIFKAIEAYDNMRP